MYRKVGVILPSRGLIFSRTAEEILDNLKTVEHKIFFSHRKPIPECFENPTREALAHEDITHLWFVEDDMIIKPGTLRMLLAADVDVITCDYPISKDGQGVVFSDPLGGVIFCGTGCTLVKREVFDKLKRPYFRTDIHWSVQNYKNHVTFVSGKGGKSLNSYGIHDVTFGMRLYKAGIPITLSDTKAGQRKLIALGKTGTNDGAHQIEEWTKIKKNYYYNLIKSWPEMPEAEGLVTVLGETGEVNVSEAYARKLIKNGLASRIPKRRVIVDDTLGLL